MGWAATKVKTQRHNEETNDCDDLDAGKNEFRFSIDGYGEYVEADDDNDDYRYPGCDVDANSAIPELNDDRSCRNFGAKGDGGGIPVLNKSGNLWNTDILEESNLRSTRPQSPKLHPHTEHRIEELHREEVTKWPFLREIASSNRSVRDCQTESRSLGKSYHAVNSYTSEGITE